MTGRDVATDAVNSSTESTASKGSFRSKGKRRLSFALRPLRLFDHFDVLGSDLLSPGLFLLATIETLQAAYQRFSEYSDWNLWQNRRFPNNMTIFSRLTFAAFLMAVPLGAGAAPPRVTGNRPVVIDVPVPDDAEPTNATPRSSSNERGFLAAVLQPESTATAGDKKQTPASELKRAREQLLKATSVSATVVETITLGDKSFKAEGKYLQQTSSRPNEWNMRLELVIKTGEMGGSLLEVCDGELLWTRTEIDFGKKRERRERKETTLTRRNVAEIMSAARRLGDPQHETTLIATFGLGGLPALIAAIEKDMKFNPVMKEETLRNRPVLVISGTWTEAFSAIIRGGGGPGTPSLLPAFVPDSVRLSIDRETGIPQRVVYEKKMPGRNIQRPMLTLDLLDVALNEPINARDFEYEPPAGVPVIEQTKAFVDMLSGSESKAPAGGAPR